MRVLDGDGPLAVRGRGVLRVAESVASVAVYCKPMAGDAAGQTGPRPLHCRAGSSPTRRPPCGTATAGTRPLVAAGTRKARPDGSDPIRPLRRPRRAARTRSASSRNSSPRLQGSRTCSARWCPRRTRRRGRSCTSPRCTGRPARRTRPWALRPLAHGPVRAARWPVHGSRCGLFLSLAARPLRRQQGEPAAVLRPVRGRVAHLRSAMPAGRPRGRHVL
jgi:hypothetical protein